MKKFKGVITALITPFSNDKIDFDSLEKLVYFQLENKIDGFVINGTTAESPTLTKSERDEIFKFVRKIVPDSIPLIIGTGSNSTQETCRSAKEAEDLGADAQLVVVPYYNKPPQRGLFNHFMKVAESTSIPTILYNVPSRTITALEIDTIKKLSEHPLIIGIKEASGNIFFSQEIRKHCGESFVILSGDDGTYEEFKKSGGDGVISVASHIIPNEMKIGDLKSKLKLIDLLFKEANPIPVKKALHFMNIIKSAECRLPLVELSNGIAKELEMEMKAQGVLK